MAGVLPADVRAMTPAETAIFVEGWNAAQGGGRSEKMTEAEYEELVARYG